MASAKESGNTDEKLEIFCDPCQTEGEYIVAVSYCEECDEYLCNHCHKAHRKLGFSRDHIVKEQNDMPDKHQSKVTKADLPDICSAHSGQVIDHYCISHEELCCSICLCKGHKNCGDVQNIADYLAEVDMEKEARGLECKMRGLTDDVNNNIFLVQKSLQAIEYYYDEAKSNMLKAKNDAVEHIESIYGTLQKELCKTREEDLNKILTYRHKCDAITFDMKAVESYFKEKKKCSNKRQIFMALKNAAVKIKSNHRDLKGMKYNIFNVTRYQFKPNPEVINLKTRPRCFGSIEVLDRLENAIKSANAVTNLHVGDSDDTNTCCVTGLAVLSESRLVLVDKENSSVKLIDTEEDRILSKLKLECAPWDVTCVSGKQVAVTVPDKKVVEFLTVTENATLEKLYEKRINCSGKCYGITSSNDQILVIVSLDGKTAKLEQYDLDGTLLLSAEVDVKNPQYIELNADKTKIYVSDNVANRYITELSSEDFSEIDTLSSCRDEVTGMAIDKTGVLYYCDSYYHEVDSVCIDAGNSKEKERVKLIEANTPHPKCLAFCNETNRLFVGNDGNDIEVYTVF